MLEMADLKGIDYVQALSRSLSSHRQIFGVEDVRIDHYQSLGRLCARMTFRKGWLHGLDNPILRAFQRIRHLGGVGVWTERKGCV